MQIKAGFKVGFEIKAEGSEDFYGCGVVAKPYIETFLSLEAGLSLLVIKVTIIQSYLNYIKSTIIKISIFNLSSFYEIRH